MQAQVQSPAALSNEGILPCRYNLRTYDSGCGYEVGAVRNCRVDRRGWDGGSLPCPRRTPGTGCSGKSSIRIVRARSGAPAPLRTGSTSGCSAQPPQYSWVCTISGPRMADLTWSLSFSTARACGKHWAAAQCPREKRATTRCRSPQVLRRRTKKELSIAISSQKIFSSRKMAGRRFSISAWRS